MMSEMIVSQVRGYVMCLVMGLAAGAAAGLVYGVISTLKRSRIVLWLCDIVLWLALSVLIIMATYIFSGGDLRLYIFLGFFSGFLPLFFTISWGVSRIVNKILYRMRHDSKKVRKRGEKVR